MGAVHMVSRTAGVYPGTNDWFNWITNTGSDGAIDIDNDGEMPDTRALVDLSHALSQRLGRQMSQMSVYKVNYIRIELENYHNTLEPDNVEGACFGGKINYWSPSKYRIDAMKLARAAEKHTEKAQLDADSYFLSTDYDYSGMRFNWDADSQVAHATSEGFANMVGDEWDLQELFNIYNVMKTPGSVQTNALWSGDGRCGFPENIGFSTSYQNYMEPETEALVEPMYNPHSVAFEWNGGANYIEVLGGLLELDFIHSSTDSPGGLEDDYKVRITVGVSGWRDF